MSTIDKNNSTQANNRLAIKLFGIVVVMVGLAYASVPLYDLFCRVTGFGGTPQVSENKNLFVTDQNISVRLDANANGLNWDFYPEKNVHVLKIGENRIINYFAKNLSNNNITGTALFNVTPEQAGQYFTKIECFCFHDLTLTPGEEIKLPVSFYIDPEIINDEYLKDLSEVTLSYTFFRNDDK